MRELDMATGATARRIGRVIARERTAKELTQERLAVQLRVEQEAISRFERGTTLPPLQRLIQLADVFDLPLEVLLRGTPNRAADKAADISADAGAAER